MGLGDTLSGVGVELPELSGGVQGGALQVLVFVIVLGCVVGGITLYIANKKQYNRHIHIFEEVNGKAIPVGLDKAKEIILPNTSIRAFFLKKKHFFLPRPSIQTGIGHYWFFIRNDGEWINVGLENLNDKLQSLGIHYDHTDMRMSNAALKKLIEKNYKKLNWVKEYAPYIALGILVIFLGLAMYLGTLNTNKAVSALEITANTNNEVLGQLSDILVSMDNLCTGSGIRST